MRRRLHGHRRPLPRAGLNHLELTEEERQRLLGVIGGMQFKTADFENANAEKVIAAARSVLGKLRARGG
ncbi:MAG: hypothetical protein EXR52_08065 [Dehalococcoidia bacterium]|nr:hypothetical protein [Dehalococcoidia bacterium]